MRIFLFFLICNSGILFAQNEIILLDHMINTISQVSSLEYELHSKELIDDKLIYSISKVKLRKSPFSIYCYMLHPRKGIEILLNGKHNDALVKPNSFPYFNLKLSPYGKLMRNKQHHTIIDSGFDNIKNILLSAIDSIKLNPKAYISNLGIKQKNNIYFNVLKITNPNFKYYKYVVKDNETIDDIAKRNHLCVYLINQKNKISFFDKINNGDIIYLPSSYAESFEIWIDLDTNLPLIQKVFINDNLFEYYEFKNIIVNKIFDENEFLESNKFYGF